jgi:hypothetical protein
LRFARRERLDSPVRAQCLLELAHRAAAHSTSGSLFDQYRAICRARAALSRTSRHTPGAVHLRRGLEGLLARRFVPPAWNAAEPELRMRRALFAGETTEAEAALAEVPAARQAYYRVLLASPLQAASELVPALQQSWAEAAAEDAPFVAEVQFHVGCAALEAGQLETTIASFADSRRRDPDAPHRELLNIHVNQLTR